MPVTRSHYGCIRGSAGPALVALLVGAVAAGATSLAVARPAPLGATTGVDVSAAVAGWVHGEAPAGSGLAMPVPGIQPTSSVQPTTSSAAPTTTTPPPTPPPATTQPPQIPVKPAPPSIVSDPGQERAVVEYVNAVRQRVGCQPVAVDQRLTSAAQAHSSDMAVRGYFSHTSPEGKTFVDRARAAGYPRPAAENIARGPRSAERVMRAWLESEGHRNNILNCEHRTIGVGLDTRGWYWTQVFGR